MLLTRSEHPDSLEFNLWNLVVAAVKKNKWGFPSLKKHTTVTACLGNINTNVFVEQTKDMVLCFHHPPRGN